MGFSSFFAGANYALALQLVLLAMLASSIALSFASPPAAWLALAVFAAAAFFAASRLPPQPVGERRAGFALACLLLVLAAFFVFFSSLYAADPTNRAERLLVVPLFLAAFLAFFLLARKFFFSSPVQARVLAVAGAGAGEWAVVRVERARSLSSLSSDVRPGVYAARCARRGRALKLKKLRKGDVVRVRFSGKGVFGWLGRNSCEAVID